MQFNNVLKKLQKLWNQMNRAGQRPRPDYDVMFTVIKQAAERNLRKVGDKHFVPVTYVIYLAPRDMDDLEDGNFHEVMSRTLQEAMHAHIRERSWHYNGNLIVRIEPKDELDDGFMGVTVKFAGYEPNSPDFRTVVRPPQGKQIASLEVLSGPQKGQVIAVTRLPASVGRSTPENHPEIRLDDPEMEIGRRHAQIIQAGDLFKILDRGSKNGTQVDDTALKPNEPFLLMDGAIITLAGIVRLRFQLGEQSFVKMWKT